MSDEIWVGSPMYRAIEEQIRRIGSTRSREIIAEIDVPTVNLLSEEQRKDFLVRLCLEMR